MRYNCVYIISPLTWLPQVIAHLANLLPTVYTAPAIGQGTCRRQGGGPDPLAGAPVVGTTSRRSTDALLGLCTDGLTLWEEQH